MIIDNFLNSYNSKVSEKDILDSMESHRESMAVKVKEVNFDQLEKWSTNSSGDFVHDSGKFFRICGARAFNKTTGEERYQPIIDQPEQGILGIITRYNNGCLEVLLQAKIEPGNLRNVQYSPTVQATKSNYTGAHKGKGVAYIQDFMPSSEKVVNRIFQSEHGYKFYRKANDNVHVHDNNASCLDTRFMWLTLGHIRFLLSKEHCINMDTRSVLATMDFIGTPLTRDEIFHGMENMNSLENQLLFSSLSEQGAKHSLESITQWVSNCKANSSIEYSTVPLNLLTDKGWVKTKNKISSQHNKQFELVGIKASIESREVSSWYQPIVRDNIPKTYAFLVKKINGIVHVLAQMVEEDYNWSGPELGPTFHSIQSQSELNENLETNNLTSENCKVIYDKYQSEEGGRFLEQKNRYMLILADENLDINMGNNFRWMTLYQLKKMTGFECSVNIEARTLLSIASYYRGEKSAH
tara:strand:+ start:5923 stop:7323 length:1401 start_codon:yes stop_codon:yes gene_type:complete